MDLQKLLQECYRQREILGRAIAMLEELAKPDSGPPRSRRGRKSMGEEERRQVSERMKKYWAGRKKPSRSSQLDR